MIVWSLAVAMRAAMVNRTVNSTSSVRGDHHTVLGVVVRSLVDVCPRCRAVITLSISSARSVVSRYSAVPSASSRPDRIVVHVSDDLEAGEISTVDRWLGLREFSPPTVTAPLI